MQSHLTGFESPVGFVTEVRDRVIWWRRWTVKWLYFPFKDISADSTMPANLKRYQDKYGATKLTVRQYGDGYFLDRVRDDDMFIVAGHGDPEDERIGVSVNAEGFFGMLGKGDKRELVLAPYEFRSSDG